MCSVYYATVAICQGQRTLTAAFRDWLEGMTLCMESNEQADEAVQLRDSSYVVQGCGIKKKVFGFYMYFED
jgi:hypothetical protein